MRKLLISLMSALMLLTSFSVNTFAEDEQRISKDDIESISVSATLGEEELEFIKVDNSDFYYLKYDDEEELFEKMSSLTISLLINEEISVSFGKEDLDIYTYDNNGFDYLALDYSGIKFVVSENVVKNPIEAYVDVSENTHEHDYRANFNFSFQNPEKGFDVYFLEKNHDDFYFYQETSTVEITINGNTYHKEDMSRFTVVNGPKIIGYEGFKLEHNGRTSYFIVNETNVFNYNAYAVTNEGNMNFIYHEYFSNNDSNHEYFRVYGNGRLVDSIVIEGFDNGEDLVIPSSEFERITFQVSDGDIFTVIGKTITYTNKDINQELEVTFWTKLAATDPVNIEGHHNGQSYEVNMTGSGDGVDYYDVSRMDPCAIQEYVIIDGDDEIKIVNNNNKFVTSPYYHVENEDGHNFAYLIYRRENKNDVAINLGQLPDRNFKYLSFEASPGFEKKQNVAFSGTDGMSDTEVYSSSIDNSYSPEFIKVVEIVEGQEVIHNVNITKKYRLWGRLFDVALIEYENAQPVIIVLRESKENIYLFDGETRYDFNGYNCIYFQGKEYDIYSPNFDYNGAIDYVLYKDNEELDLSNFTLLGMNIYGYMYEEDNVVVVYALGKSPQYDFSNSVTMYQDSTYSFSYSFTDFDGMNGRLIDYYYLRTDVSNTDISKIGNLTIGAPFTHLGSINRDQLHEGYLMGGFCSYYEINGFKISPNDDEVVNRTIRFVVASKYEGNNGGNNDSNAYIEAEYYEYGQYGSEKKFGELNFMQEGGGDLRFYRLNVPNGNLVNAATVKEIHFRGEDSAKTLPVEKIVLTGYGYTNQLVYAAVERDENGIVTAYYVLDAASIFDKAELIAFGKSFPLSFNNYHNKFLWQIDYSSLSDQQNLIIYEVIKNVESINPTINLYENLTDETPSLTIQAKDFTVINKYGVHANAYEYYKKDNRLNYSEKSLIAFDFNDCVEDFKSVIKAEFVVSGQKYNYNLEPVINGKVTTYYLDGDGSNGLSRDDIFGDRNVSLEYSTTKGKTRKIELYSMNGDYTNGKEINYFSFYYTKNGDPDYQIKFIVLEHSNDNQPQIDQELYENSYIRLASNDFKYSLFEEGRTTADGKFYSVYNWNIYLDPKTTSVDIAFDNYEKNNNKIMVKDILDYNLNHSEQYSQFYKVENDRQIFTLNKNYRSIIFVESIVDQVNGENECREGSEQYHELNFSYDNELCMKYIPIANTDISNLWVGECNFGNNNEIFNYADLSAYENANNGGNKGENNKPKLYKSLINAINNGDYGKCKEVEQELLKIEFKPGAVVTRTYELDDKNLPIITYNITYNGEKQILQLRYTLESNYYTGILSINNRPAHSEMTIKDGKLYNYYVYDNLGSYHNIDESFEFVNYEYSDLMGYIENTYNENDSYDKVITHFEGKDYFVNRRLNFNFYNLENVELNYNQNNELDLASLKITELNEPAYYKIGWFGGSYSDMLRKIEQIKTTPSIAYCDENGNYNFDLEYCETKADLEAYSGNKPAYTMEIKKQIYSTNTNYCIYITFKFSKLNDICLLENYISFDESKVDNNIPKDLDFTGMSSKDATDLFIKTINNYTNGNVTIKLLSDLTIDRDIYLRHNNYTLVLDLNGHNINVGNHSLELPQYNNVEFYNSNKNIESIISGNNSDALIEVYSTLSTHWVENHEDRGKIKFINNSGIVARVHGLSHIYNDEIVTFEGKTAIYFDLNDCDIEQLSHENTIENNIRSKVNASDIAIVFDAENAKEYNKKIKFSLCNCDIVSSNVGVLVKGPASVDIECASIKAKSPLICVDSKNIRISEAKLIVDSISYNSNYSYTKHYGDEGFTTNGAAVLIDSKADNTASVEVDILLNGPYPYYSKINAAGPVIAEVKDINKASNINVVSIEATTPYIENGFINSSSCSDYLLVNYGSENLYENIESYKIEVASGLYAKAIRKDNISDSSEVSNAKDENNNIYTVVRKGNTSVRVNNESDLKEALKNKAIEYIYVNNNIEAINNKSLEVKAGKAGKSLDLNGYTLSGFNFNIDSLLIENDWRSMFRIYKGTICDDSANPTLLIKKGNVQLEGVNITNNSGVAIKVVDGEVNLVPTYVWDETYTNYRIENDSISGTIGILVDNPNGTYSAVDIYGANVCGTNGPAIEFANTPNRNDSYLYISSSYSDDAEKSTIESLGNYPAVLVRDELRDISVNKAIINGENAIKVDINSGEGPYIYLNNTTIAASGDALDLKGTINENYSQRLYISSATINANKNVVKAINYLIDIEDGIFNKGTDYKFIDNSSLDKNRYYNLISGGKYNGKVTDKELNSSSYTFGKTYACFDPSEDGGYFEVAVKSTNGSATIQNIAISNKRTIKIDQDSLTKVADKQANNSKITMNIAESETNNFNSELNVKESFDISVNANGTNLDVLTDYQKIAISVSGITTLVEVKDEESKTLESVPLYNNPENIVVYHDHNGDVSPMKKIAEPETDEPSEECYYLSEENGETYVNIITRRFSSYGFAENETEVKTAALKEFKEMVLSYDEVYTVNSLAKDSPTSATILLDGKQTSVELDEVRVVYEGIDNEFKSENELPTIPGTYKVEWILNEDSPYGVKSTGSDTFKLVEEASEDCFAKVDQYSVSTNGNVAINFYFWLTDAANQDQLTKAILTGGANTTSYNIKDLTVCETLEGMKEYKVTYALNSKEMGTIVSLKLVDGQGREIVMKDSDDQVIGNEWISSINEYLETVMESEDPALSSLIPLANAMYDFGELAKSYFNKKVAIPSDAVEEVTIDELKAYKAVESGSSSFRKALLRQSSLVLETETTIKHYFKHADGYTFEVTDVNGNNVEYTLDTVDGYDVVKIKDIAAKNLSTTYVVKITNSNGEVYTLKYSALSYAYDALYFNANDSLQLLAKSLYLYNREAVAYMANR